MSLGSLARKCLRPTEEGQGCFVGSTFKARVRRVMKQFWARSFFSSNNFRNYLQVSQSIFLNAESAILFLRRICSYFFSTVFSSLASGKKGPGPFFVRVENQKFISATVTTVASNRWLIKTLKHHLDLPRFRVLIPESWHCEKSRL